jgi:hypothetical protein
VERKQERRNFTRDDTDFTDGNKKTRITLKLCANWLRKKQRINATAQRGKLQQRIAESEETTEARET